MDKVLLMNLFEEILDKYESSETACINEFSIETGESDELEKQIIEYRERFDKALNQTVR